MKQIEKMGKSFGVLLLACLIATVFLLSACGGDNDNNSNINIESNAGDLPVFKGGDTWTQRGPINGTECTIVFTVTGEDTVNGRGTYAVEGSVEPLISGVVNRITMKLDKETLFQLEMRMYNVDTGSQFNAVVNYSYEMSGDPYYPMKVGNVSTFVSHETTVVVANGETQSSDEVNTYIYKVKKVENVTVPAGTFTCFKIVRYDETNTVLDTSWESAAVKHFNVKTLYNETKEIQELIAYSVSP